MMAGALGLIRFASVMLSFNVVFQPGTTSSSSLLINAIRVRKGRLDISIRLPAVMLVAFTIQEGNRRAVGIVAKRWLQVGIAVGLVQDRG